MQSVHRYKYICISFDALDTAGKSTTIEQVTKRLTEKGFTVKVFKDLTDNNESTSLPSDKPSFITEIRETFIDNKKYKELKKSLTPLLITIPRLNMIEDIYNWINTRDETEKIVILLDRYVQSTLAYQQIIVEDETLTNYLCEYAYSLLKPDLHILLDITYETFNKRIQQKLNPDQMELSFNVDRINEIRQTYLNNFKKHYNNEEPFYIIDNNIFNKNIHILNTLIDEGLERVFNIS